MLTLRAILLSLVASTLVIAVRWIWGNYPEIASYAPWGILGITVLFLLLLPLFRRDRYAGIADFLFEIHSPPKLVRNQGLGLRSVFSFLFSLTGGVAGVEGAAMEGTHGVAVRSRQPSANWYEQHRRTDAAIAVASGLAGAFGAPLAAILAAMEFGIGGRALVAGVSALTSFFCVKVAEEWFMLTEINYGPFFQDVHFQDFFDVEFLTYFLLSSLAAAFLALCFVLLTRAAQHGVFSFFQQRRWIQYLIGGALLTLVVFAFPNASQLPEDTLEQLLSGQMPWNEGGLFLLSRILSLTLVLSVFGTAGVFWPLFLVGGLAGFLVGYDTLFVSVLVFATASAVLGGVMGLPIAASVLSLELTQSVPVLIPCLVASLFVNYVREKIRMDSSAEHNLREGAPGRVLESLVTKDAMTTNFEFIQEHESVSKLYSRLMESQYPFLVVVDGEGGYRGLLTVDMIERAWKSYQDPERELSDRSLVNLLEAKDLLYRSKNKTPTVLVTSSLAGLNRFFERTPVIPVLDSEGKPKGLLFAHRVRIAYEEEMARRSFFFEREQMTILKKEG